MKGQQEKALAEHKNSKPLAEVRLVEYIYIYSAQIQGYPISSLS